MGREMGVVIKGRVYFDWMKNVFSGYVFYDIGCIVWILLSNVWLWFC